jgi:hypothetical protein
MAALLGWRFWLGLALSVFLAFTHFTTYRAGKAVVRAEWTAEKLAQSEAARQREKGMTIANAKIDKDLQNEKARIAADGKRLADGLRDLRTVLASDNAGTSSGTDDPRDAIIDQCATAVVGLDEYAKAVALKASGLQRYAREVCLIKESK